MLNYQFGRGNREQGTGNREQGKKARKKIKVMYKKVNRSTVVLLKQVLTTIPKNKTWNTFKNPLSFLKGRFH